MPTRSGNVAPGASRAAGDPEDARHRALKIIAEVFRRFGYEAATMSILSRETGLGRSSLYYHFPGGKQEMALAMLDLAEIFLRDDLMARLAGEGTSDQKIECFITRLKIITAAGRSDASSPA
ncbi:MAG TPA: helix-turn-helix domain-containing protein [Rhodoblastus sp.]|nr:helix-turn-helix domain-containing protein [Rhodoblastus sp.]